MPDLPDVAEPGMRLVGRYRLEHQQGASAGPNGAAAATVTTTGGGQVAGATYWRAHDELLDRPVGVWLLRDGSSYAERVLAAARRAAALTDARFLRILDAASGEGMVYVVSEWVPARSLVTLVADGPLPAAEARSLAAEITAALATAHAEGLAHLALRPEHVLRTPHGQVKLAGLEVEAAARDIRLDDPAEAARRDTQGAARVLYAALTGRWPGAERTGLPPAPLDGATVCSPRQVRAGVPDDLDDVVRRALGLPGGHGPALHTLSALRESLANVQLTSRIPVPGLAAARGHGPTPGLDADPALPAYGPQAPDAGPEPLPRRSRTTLVAWVLVGLVLLVGVALAGGQLVTDLGRDGGVSAGSGDQPADGPGSNPVQDLAVASATGFDPQGDSDDDGAENDSRARLAVDGDAGTAWNTKTYLDPFGPTGLKEGVGLLLELKSPAQLTEIGIEPVGGATDFQVRVADRASDSLEDYRTIAEDANVAGPAELRLEEPAPARYVLIWLTAVPAVADGFRGEIAEVTLRGTR